jgi:hypothetical protein
MRSKDTLLVSAAGNTGGQITIPADSYNGIAVGAMDESTQSRWSLSAYTLNGGADSSEVRGKPDILAPGVNVVDGISFNNHPESGTSFAAPHVAGAAALLVDYNTHHPTADALNHLGIKAVIMNSARKRNIVAPEVLSPVSYDSAAADASFDKDYLNCGMSGCTIANPGTARLTSAWTPSAWTFDGTKFSTPKPLDDEQGVGFLDADRAIINLAGGNLAPGPVAGIGWDQTTIQTSDAAALHTYMLNQTIAAGSFLTATLAWDRVVTEGDGNGIVNDSDNYSLGELANLDLRVLNAANQVVAESVSTTDNIQHLHVPLAANGAPGSYKLQVTYAGGGVLPTDYALAWWTSEAPLVPGDYNLDGIVNAADYDIWKNNFGTTTDTSPLVYGDGDGAVTAADYAIWRDHFGQTWSGLGDGSGSGVTVPEPSSSVAAFILLVFMATWRLHGRLTHAARTKRREPSCFAVFA